MIYLIRRRDPFNTGDWWCGPEHYFDLPYEKRDIADLPPLTPDDTVILGGGGMLGIFEEVNLIQQSGCRTILWGVGGNIPHATEHAFDTSWCALEGRRDVEPFLPCVSCLHPVWDLQIPVTQKEVHISHKDVKIPAEYDNTRSIRKLAYLIHSAEKVVTTSYHVWYWATLLGKEVEIPNKWSSKFHYLRPVPLEEARELNREFYQKAKQLL